MKNFSQKVWHLFIFQCLMVLLASHFVNTMIGRNKYKGIAEDQIPDETSFGDTFNEDGLRETAVRLQKIDKTKEGVVQFFKNKHTFDLFYNKLYEIRLQLQESGKTNQCLDELNTIFGELQGININEILRRKEREDNYPGGDPEVKRLFGHFNIEPAGRLTGEQQKAMERETKGEIDRVSKEILDLPQNRRQGPLTRATHKITKILTGGSSKKSSSKGKNKEGEE